MRGYCLNVNEQRQVKGTIGVGEINPCFFPDK
jgi:hypothetical protein